jgi:hypothetical protein
MSDQIDHLPVELRDAARKLPPEKAHTVLDLPPPGSGHNSGLIRVACICYRMGVTPEDTLAHLWEIYESRGDHKTATRRAIERAWAEKGVVPTDGNGEEDDAPEAREEMLNRFKRTSRAELVTISPTADPSKVAPLEFIRALYAPDEIVNIQRTSREHGTLMKCSDLPSDLDEFKFLNPSNFKGLTWTDQKSKKTMTRCNGNVKSRRYALLECDFPDSDPDADAKGERFNTLLIELSQYLPVVAIVDTGGKSNHGWIDTAAATPDDLKVLKQLAVLHFADKQMFVLSQIARMPNVSAAKEGRGSQTLIYFDPEPAVTAWDIKGFEAHLQKSSRLEYFYDSKSKNYYMQTESGRWGAVNRQSLIVHLVRQGFRSTRTTEEMISPAENVIAVIELRKSVEAVMTGASGHHAGYYYDNGITYLVLKSPQLIKPKKGDWSTIREFLTHAMHSDPIQYPLFLGILSADVRNYRNNGQRRSRQAPYQVPHIVGQGNAGKTIFAKYILPMLFGGRRAKANPLFDPKGSDFNSEMHQAEVLILDDAAVLESGHKYRHMMSETVKEVSVGGGMDYHGKFGDKLAIQPWWRLWRMLNDEADTLATLPLLDDSVADKWIAFLWSPMPGGPVDMSPGWFDKWIKKVKAELPAFIHYLLHEHIILPEHQDPFGRYAIKNYKNPDIIARMKEDSTENALLHKLDNDLVTFDDSPWEGTTGALYDLLSDAGSTTSQRRFMKFCASPRILTAQLKTLEKDSPHRVQHSGRADIIPKKRAGAHYWRITTNNISTEDCY